MAVYEIPGDKYNMKLAEALKNLPEFKMPEWAVFVKTGVSRQRPSVEKDFWHKRAASILRFIHIRKNIGVNRLRTKYGSKKNRGMRPEKFFKAGGKILRTILQQSDKAGFTEIGKQVKGTKKRRAGRQLTKKGTEFLEAIK